ncbi:MULTISPECIES: PadR family transcriptional regulator [Paenibacillus]|uniref:PadR family transcriptional regulator n=1 Tax=Paenibacillus TaxID=44249 RepID=UPI0004083FA1|nr:MULTISPECIES: helix-turn-helix transcriptional regulator [Paenibacillus]KGP77696.1 PadR family transcriptional regulator [Paenibacillus sp. MAEPY2]KGP78685.1 PadR family transcriptional regulator [Paenibacillus sp. MAEPY1]OZQ62809.1 PadR family transcriptional regulator [Paenibacillus taichungensis]PQP80281.1 PadR family transcriptional regulator [Paenibacillus sp. PCH8]
MRKDTTKIDKQSSLGHVVKVQQVIDFLVLAELQSGRRFGKELDQVITKTLKGVGVNDSYLTQRLKKLAEKGHAHSYWESENRYYRYYEITESGIEYFKQLQRDLPDRVSLALRVYKAFESTLKKYE